jgi:LuxR family maltose regulon positive regulatory protein
MAAVVLGKAGARAGEPTAAEQIEQALRVAEREDSWLIRTYGLLALAEALHRHGDRTGARRLLAQARRELERLPDPGIGPELITRTKRMLKLTPRRRTADAGGHWDLSDRELTALRKLPSNLTQREIADQLYVSFATIKTHNRAIFQKLGVASRSEAVERARELGLL